MAADRSVPSVATAPDRPGSDRVPVAGPVMPPVEAPPHASPPWPRTWTTSPAATAVRVPSAPTTSLPRLVDPVAPCPGAPPHRRRAAPPSRPAWQAGDRYAAGGGAVDGRCPPPAHRASGHEAGRGRRHEQVLPAHVRGTRSAARWRCRRAARRGSVVDVDAERRRRSRRRSVQLAEDAGELAVLVGGDEHVVGPLERRLERRPTVAQTAAGTARPGEQRHPAGGRRPAPAGSTETASEVPAASPTRARGGPGPPSGGRRRRTLPRPGERAGLGVRRAEPRWTSTVRHG